MIFKKISHKHLAKKWWIVLKAFEKNAIFAEN
jgi:hypothetical protein